MELIESVKIWDRMCESVNRECEKCELSRKNNGKDLPCSTFMLCYPKEFEEILQKWADEHPIETNLQHYEKTIDYIEIEYAQKIRKEFNLMIGNYTRCDDYHLPTCLCEKQKGCRECQEWWNSPYKKSEGE